MPTKVGGLEFYTTQEAATQLSLHPTTLLRYIKTGKIKAKKVGKRYLIQQEMLVEFLIPEPIIKA